MRRAFLPVLALCGCAAGGGIIVPGGASGMPYGAALCASARTERKGLGASVSCARVHSSWGFVSASSDIVFLEGYGKLRASETMDVLIGCGKAIESAEFDGFSFEAGSAFVSLGATGKVAEWLDVRISCAFLLESTNVAYTGFLLLEHPF